MGISGKNKVERKSGIAGMEQPKDPVFHHGIALKPHAVRVKLMGGKGFGHARAGWILRNDKEINIQRGSEATPCTQGQSAYQTVKRRWVG